MYDIYMKAALDEAKRAYEDDEVPIGAVIVKDERIIAAAHNMREQLNDPTAHAEIIAIRKAASILNSWRLNDCDIYVTIEPCSMCAGAIVLARIKKVIYGAKDPKAGACGSILNIAANEKLNHRAIILGGILEYECSSIVKEYFKEKRGYKQKDIIY